MKVLLAFCVCATFGLGLCQQRDSFNDPCKTKSRTTPHEDQCDLYYECYDGQPVIQECPNGLVYNGGRRLQGVVGVCDYDFDVDCSGRPGRNPCDSKFLIVADDSHCDRYWSCERGQPQLRNCPNGLAFAGARRGLAENCDYPFREDHCLYKPRANPPISTEHCDWLYGVFGHETSCTRYWTCWNGTATEQFCIGGLLYNEKTHSCDWPENVEGCQKHPLCKNGANANVPLGNSCERYWSCQGGYPRLQRCPATLVFDRSTRRCLSPPTEDCEAPPPPPPSEQNDGFYRQGPQGPSRANARRRRPSQQQQQQQQQPTQDIPERQQFIEEQPQQQQRPALFRPAEEARPRRPRPRTRPALPENTIPDEAQPIIFEAPLQEFAGSEDVEVRQPPIEGAIPLLLN